MAAATIVDGVCDGRARVVIGWEAKALDVLSRLAGLGVSGSWPPRFAGSSRGRTSADELIEVVEHLIEFLFHAWDFTRATGREVVASALLSDYSFGGGRQDDHAGSVRLRDIRRPGNRSRCPNPRSADRVDGLSTGRPRIRKPTNLRTAMPKKTEYAQGTPNWVDLQTTDQSAAKQFYSSLFGWSYDDRPMPDGGAVYAMATVNGEAVAAIARCRRVHPRAGRRCGTPTWRSTTSTRQSTRSHPRAGRC